MRKIAALALLCLTCSSSSKAVVVLALSYDSSVKNADQITNLQVTVDGVVRSYAVPRTASFGNCTASASPPCTLEIDTSRTGQLGIAVVGTGESSDGGPSKAFGMGSGSAMAEAGKVQTVLIQLSCSSGTCGTVVVGTDGGGGTGGGAGLGGRGQAGTAGGGVLGAGGMAGGTGVAGRSGTTGVGGTTGIAGSHGTGGGGMGGTSPGGMTGTAGTTGAGGAGGISGTGGGSGTGGTNAAGGTIGTAGTTGTAGAGGTSSPKNCVDAIKLNGYSFTGAEPCSACKENGADESVKCEMLIDCEDSAYPCTGNCQINCQNMAGADSAVLGCASSLARVSCGT
jgi:hypothetical protein